MMENTKITFSNLGTNYPVFFIYGISGDNAFCLIVHGIGIIDGEINKSRAVLQIIYKTPSMNPEVELVDPNSILLNLNTTFVQICIMSVTQGYIASISS